MAKQIVDLRNKLRAYRFEFDLLQDIPCTDQENAEYQSILKQGGTLPQNVHPYVYDTGEVSQTEFCTTYKSDLTESEIREYLTYTQLHFLKTIKNCVLFFTVSAIIGIIAYLLIVFNTL